MNDQKTYINTVITNDQIRYEINVNKLLKLGYKVLSTHCSATSGPIEYTWMAILELTPADLT